MRTGATLGLMLLALLLAPTSVLADTTVIVGGDTASAENEPGWMFDRDQTTSTEHEFTADEASIGRGSLYVPPIGPNPSDKFIAEYFLLQPVDGLDDFSFDYLLGTNTLDPESNDVDQVYLNVYTNAGDSDPKKFYDCRYDYVASAPIADDWTTMTVTPDTTPTRVVRRSTAPYLECPATLAALVEEDPYATIRAFAINLGDTSASDQGVNGYFDEVILTQSGASTTFDFEPEPPSKDTCKKGGYVDYGFRNQGQCVSYVASHGRSS